MCGINLILNKKASAVDREAVERANQALTHRGPDDSSIHCIDNIALGHTRLSIVDVTGGNQPFFNEDQSVAVICNGEIYNFEQLRQQLVDRGHQFRSRCDCEVIAHLYEDDPHDYISQLDGMFAFILVDSKRGVVHAARDRVGIKPLCCYEDSDHLVLSSEVSGIFATNLAPRELNGQGIYDAFTFGYVPGCETAFRGIEHIPPGTLVSWSSDGSSRTEREYWTPTFPERSNKGSFRRGRYLRELRRRFADAVGSHQIGDVPLSSYLSGGMDSTITAITLRRLMGDDQALKTFSIKVAGEGYDESPIFEQTVDQFGFDSQTVTLDQVDPQMFFDAVCAIQQPQFSPLDVPMQLLSRLVRDNGIKVAFSGEGSDELLGGYLYFTLNQIRRAIWIPAAQSIRRPLLMQVLPYYISDPTLQNQLVKLYLSNPASVIERFGTYPPWYPLWIINISYKKPLFADEWTDSGDESRPFFQIAQPLTNQLKDIDDFNKSIYLELKTRLPNYILHRTDRNTMINSVEARVPFLANSMIDFTANVPPLFKLFGLKEKYIIRKAFKRDIPQHVLERRKFGYNAPSSWLWKNKHPLVEELMSDSYLKKVGLFDPANVKTYRDELTSNTASPTREHLLSAHLTGILTTHMLHQHFC